MGKSNDRKRRRRRERRPRFLGWRKGRQTVVIDLDAARRAREIAARNADAHIPERPEPEPPSAAMGRVA